MRWPNDYLPMPFILPISIGYLLLLRKMCSANVIATAARPPGPFIPCRVAADTIGGRRFYPVGACSSDAVLKEVDPI